MAQAPTCPNLAGLRIVGAREKCMEGMHRVALPRVLRHGLSRAATRRAVVAWLVSIALVACSSAAQKPQTTPVPTFGAHSLPAPTAASGSTNSATADEIPDAPVTTSAIVATRPQHGSSTPVGA